MHFDLEIHQMDVKTTFLHGNLNQTIYMVQHEGLSDNDSMQIVCKLRKSIYGLKQASRQWYQRFHQVILSFGFEVNIVDDCVYHKFCRSKVIFLILYVNDILRASINVDMLLRTKSFLPRNFEMKNLGLTSFILGIQTHEIILVEPWDYHKWTILGRSYKSLACKIVKHMIPL